MKISHSPMKGQYMSETALELEGTPEVPDSSTVTQDAGTKMVPAERFNGLQRVHQEALAKIRVLEAAQASGSQTKPETPANTNPEPESDVTQLLQDLYEERLERWRDEAIKTHPSVAPLREYLTATTKAGVLELAKDLSEKLGGSTPSEEATPVTTPTPTAPPAVPGGSPALTGNEPADADAAKLAELRAEAKRTQNWAPYLQFQRELAGWPF